MDNVRHHCYITGYYIVPYCNRCNLQLKFRNGRNDKKQKSSPYNNGCQKKFCCHAETTLEDAAIEELVSSEFEMNGDNFMLPVFFHNLKGFDSNIIMSYIDRNFAPSDIQVISAPLEKCMSFQIRIFIFIDSLQYLNTSLESLVQSLAKDRRDNFHQTQWHFADNDLIFQKKRLLL